MKKITLILFFVCVLVGAWFVYSEIFSAEAQDIDVLAFDVNPGESVAAMAERFEQEQVVRSAWLFSKYVSYAGFDTEIRPGQYEVSRPVTIARVARVLGEPGLSERTITIIPGWDLDDIGAYLEREGVGSRVEFLALVGEPAVQGSGGSLGWEKQPQVLLDKPVDMSYEGYVVTDSFRVYNNATLEDVVYEMISHRDEQFTEEMYQVIEQSGHSVHEIITMASVLEREAKTEQDKRMIADIFWRRIEAGWVMQSDATVSYASRRKGDVFTTDAERASLSPWNTYQYPGLPVGPITSPSLESIMAATYPEENEYWYFLATLDTGEVKYAEDFEGHNANVRKYLR